ncbi:MAG: hypothetical protein PSV23_00460 [Brevundimonas sp.]|uniref:hypothetical protein n=1 Tax=Brevundimonas sp. TaxID=1871086 RepID=UPI0024896E3C|nr:hypothetical protein [Brevundimonas sp.]MDI1325260.1 hypothetical protein [Brevundimonas sp.]
MNIRTGVFAGGVILAAALAGVATSQQQPPSPVAAAQVDLPRTRADNAALAAAQKEPLTARLRGVLSQDSVSRRVLTVADASPVPVLAPADPALLRTARIFTGDRHYMLVVQRGAQIIEIYGSTKAFHSPLAPASPQQSPTAALTTGTLRAVRPMAPATIARTGPRIAAARVPPVASRAVAQARTEGLTNVRTERTEYGVDVTFSRFGAAYNVSFICEGPGAAGCTEPEAITFASTLQLIGGGAS